MVKALITGHTGFKGTWLTKYLMMLGWNLTGYSIDYWSICPLDIEHFIGDIRNAEYLQSIVNKVKPDIIFHLAAQPLVSVGYKYPKMTFETNVMGTLNILEAASCPVLVITTDKVVANFTKDPYTSSKIAAEAIANSYGAATARAGNCLGGGDMSIDRIIPDIIRAERDGTPLHIRRLEARRPFQHVLEPLTGYIILAEKLLENPNFGGNWNFGPNETHSVGELLQEWGYKHYVEEAPQFEEDLDLNLDSSETIKILKWKPIWDFPATISITKDWYRKQSQGENPEILMEEDINEYKLWWRLVW